KARTKKNVDLEKACIEVIGSPKLGKLRERGKECDMIMKKTLQIICLLTINPNTTMSIIPQVSYLC
ncbi:hypothetical protein LINPERPRIM_LOCUS25302, partial [Linum perenne]